MFHIDRDIVNKNYICKVSFNKRTLSFNLKYYSIYCNSAEKPDPFKYLNAYLETRPDIKEKIFIQLEEILDTFHNVWDTEQLERKLKTRCVKLLNVFDLQDTVAWIQQSSDIIIPKVFLEEYDNNISKDLLGTREQTYLKSDYRELLALSIILRSMIVVWSEFIVLRQKELGTVFKEFRAFKLAEEADIFSTPAFLKLYEYIARIVEKAVSQNNNTFKVLAGVSSEDLPSWAVSATIVRRVVTAGLETEEDSTNSLITNIYGFAFSKMMPPTNVAGTLRDKKVADTGVSENDKTSSLENYKITSELAAGTVVELDHSVSNYDRIIELLAPDIDSGLINDCFECKDVLVQTVITEPQLTLLKWVMAPVINPRAITYLCKDRVVDLLCMTSAILWYRGHQYLSLITTSTIITDDDVISVSATTGKSKINLEMKEKLDSIFPYKNIKKSIEHGEVYNNVVLDSINDISQEISSQIWTMGLSSKYVEDHFGEVNAIPPVPYDIRNIVARLVVSLAEDRKEVM